MQFLPMVEVVCVDIYDNVVSFFFIDDEYFEIKLDMLVDRDYTIKKVTFPDYIKAGEIK